MCDKTPRLQNLKSDVGLLLDYLVSEGYRPHLTDTGNVNFKREGKFYCIEFDAQDPTFVMIIAPNIQHGLPDCSLDSQLAAAAQATRDIKVAKAVVLEGQTVNASVEARYARMSHFTAVMPLLLNNLDTAVKEFSEHCTTDTESAEQVINRCKS